LVIAIAPRQCKIMVSTKMVIAMGLLTIIRITGGCGIIITVNTTVTFAVVVAGIVEREAWSNICMVEELPTGVIIVA